MQKISQLEEFEKMQENTVAKQIVTQFELSNLIRKTKLFSKIKLAPATRLVLESLVYHFPNIRVNIKTLEEETGNSRRSIDNALNELREKGLVLTIQTGRSSIFNLTQKFFDLLEVAPQTCRKEPARHAEIALPHNKQNNKNLKKDFQNNFSKNNESVNIKKLLEKDSYLSNKQRAEVLLSGYHQHNIKESDFETILQLKNIWNFKTGKFPILKHFQERKQTDHIFRKKIENLDAETSEILQGFSTKITELKTAWLDYMPELCE